MNQPKFQPDSIIHGGLRIPMEEPARLRWQERFNSWPAVRHLGMRLDLEHAVASRIELIDVHPHHLGGAGDASQGGGPAVNGAILASLFDAALGVAGALQFPDRRAATVELSLKMFRPVLGGAVAFGWAIKRTPSVVFVEGALFDKDFKRCAQASGLVGAMDSELPKPLHASERAAPAWY